MPNGETAEFPDISGLVGDAVEKAAAEAEEQARDRSTVKAPIERLERARKELERDRDSLPRARALPEWDESEFGGRLTAVGTIIADLEGNR